ncbi:MAG: gamma-glutamylcyclotransferase family protein [Acidobacteriaceae bacterium]
MNEHTWISPNCQVSKWILLRKSLANNDNNGEWSEAVEIFRDRLNNRFFTPIERLRDAEKSMELGFGFAMLTLDCLLIDTIESFREGRIKGSEKSTANAFKQFFSKSGILEKEFTNTLKRNFYDAIRCGLMHDGETRKGWLVWEQHPDPTKIVDKDQDGHIILYRNNFHKAIVGEFDRYTSELLSGELLSLRENFLKRMDAICGLAPASPEIIEYFAYGSNMNPERMFGRIKSALPNRVARLSGYRLVFNKRSVDGTAKANIERSSQEADFVLGCVY